MHSEHTKLDIEIHRRNVRRWVSCVSICGYVGIAVGGVWAVYSGRYGIGMGFLLGLNVLTVFSLYWLFSKRTRPFRLGGK